MKEIYSGDTPVQNTNALWGVTREKGVSREKNLQADALGNIYRSAYYMAKGERGLATSLVEKVKTVSPELYEKAWEIINSKFEDKVIAEYLLDLYSCFRVGS
ncbi:hypothetical protein L6255_01910 [Candidatus Parcubacteria bacterium]|nr:hypothetical protein [Patescibacteria group bacterium]MBU4381106.1 hypothetical protein [Patescibacteria group bacterium]MCG2689171.1 hypothetical protein [Candidatus Parcubacteria bacterium]